MKLPKKTSVLVTGPPRSGKQAFAEQLLGEALAQGEDAVYFVSIDFPENVIPRMDKHLSIIDCYTAHAGIDKSHEGVYSVNGPYALNEISIALTNILKSKTPAIAVFNSLSTLLLHNKLSELVDFLGLNIRKLKAKGTTVLLLAEEGVHAEKDITMIEAVTDMTIQFAKDTMVMKSPREERTIKYKLSGNQLITEA